LYFRYRFLQTECGIFLDKFEVMTVFHLRDLANNKRKKITCEGVKVFQAPQYKYLNTAEMIHWAKAYHDVANYFPDEPREVEILHRDYVSSVIYTIVGAPFKKWVTDMIKIRDAEVEKKRDMNIHLDPQIAEILKKSTSDSISKGISNSLFKVSSFLNFISR
jgi:hypothetical protein